MTQSSKTLGLGKGVGVNLSLTHALYKFRLKSPRVRIDCIIKTNLGLIKLNLTYFSLAFNES